MASLVQILSNEIPGVHVPLKGMPLENATGPLALPSHESATATQWTRWWWNTHCKRFWLASIRPFQRPALILTRETTPIPLPRKEMKRRNGPRNAATHHDQILTELKRKTCQKWCRFIKKLQRNCLEQNKEISGTPRSAFLLRLVESAFWTNAVVPLSPWHQTRWASCSATFCLRSQTFCYLLRFIFIHTPKTTQSAGDNRWLLLNVVHELGKFFLVRCGFDPTKKRACGSPEMRHKWNCNCILHTSGPLFLLPKELYCQWYLCFQILYAIFCTFPLSSQWRKRSSQW